jgi:hypothetical protein
MSRPPEPAARAGRPSRPPEPGARAGRPSRRGAPVLAPPTRAGAAGPAPGLARPVGGRSLVRVGILYVGVALLAIPALLGLFHGLSRTPKVTSQPPGAADPVPTGDLAPGAGERLAEEAHRWLRSQSSA